jgi:hypothetical protein
LQHDAAELQADREFVLEAARQNGTALHYAAGVLAAAAELQAELKADRELVLGAVRLEGHAATWTGIAT